MVLVSVARFDVHDKYKATHLFIINGVVFSLETEIASGPMPLLLLPHADHMRDICYQIKHYNFLLTVQSFLICQPSKGKLTFYTSTKIS